MDVVVVAQQLRRSIPAGIGTYTRGLLSGLAAIGDSDVRVTIHASRHLGGGVDPLASLGADRVVASPLPGPLLTRLWDHSLGRAPSGDVVHATSLAFPPERRRPLCVYVHDLAWREVPDAFPPRGRRWHEAAFLRARAHARSLLVPSTSVADQVVRAGADASQVEVVEEGADHLPPADIGRAEALLGRLGARDGFLLTVSTLEPRKNLAALLAAYELARPDLPEPWPLVIVGPEGWGDAFGGRGVPHGVVLAGHIDDATLTGLYRLCRCLVYVPLAEGFGLPPVEAMRECAPVVASPVPSTAGAALEVDPRDVHSIARGLVAATSDERVRSELVTAGLLRAGELTWESAARRHIDIWRAAVDAP